MSTVPPPPPPPEDPFPAFTNGDGADPFAIDGEQPLDQGRPSVAAKPGRALMVLVIVGGVLLFLLYNIFSGGEEKPAEETSEPPVATVAPPTEAPPPLPAIEEAPPELPPTFVPPSVPQPTALPELRPEDDAAAKESQKTRLRSDMMVVSGGGGSGGIGGLLGGGDTAAPNATESSDPNLQFAAGASTKAARVSATHIGNLARTIAQGRIIQATTESVINTELPAPIRAIVSRDTYAESGTIPLIPKGSRLIGQYNTQLLGGQSRVYVIWNRVIRPDGVDVKIDSPLVDQIGQAGIGGQVDSKFQQIFSRSLLASVVTVAFAIGSDEITGGGQTSTTNSAIGGVSQSGDGATTATVNALNRLGSTTDGFLQKYLNLQPSILVDQGTPINVFVNQDLVFPSEFTGARVIN